MKVADYIAHETERQFGTMSEAVGMYQAWLLFSVYRANNIIPDVGLFKDAAFYIKGTSSYRSVPVTFANGGYSVSPALIRGSMDALNDAIEEFWTKDEVRQGYHTADEWVDLLVQEFLVIHPFLDGNGRVGSLLWNSLRGSLSDPEPMPYFFGEKP